MFLVLFSLFIFCFLWGFFFLLDTSELADKSGKKRLICGNLVSLVCYDDDDDDDDVYLIYTHPYVCTHAQINLGSQNSLRNLSKNSSATSSAGSAF